MLIFLFSSRIQWKSSVLLCYILCWHPIWISCSSLSIFHIAHMSTSHVWKLYLLQVSDKKVSAKYYGPAENAHVANYRMVLREFPFSFKRAKWSDLERQNLEKGIKQQFQEMLLQKSVDMFRYGLQLQYFTMNLWYVDLHNRSCKMHISCPWASLMSSMLDRYVNPNGCYYCYHCSIL